MNINEHFFNYYNLHISPFQSQFIFHPSEHRIYSQWPLLTCSTSYIFIKFKLHQLISWNEWQWIASPIMGIVAITGCITVTIQPWKTGYCCIWETSFLFLAFLSTMESKCKNNLTVTIYRNARIVLTNDSGWAVTTVTSNGHSF